MITFTGYAKPRLSRAADFPAARRPRQGAFRAYRTALSRGKIIKNLLGQRYTALAPGQEADVMSLSPLLAARRPADRLPTVCRGAKGFEQA